jgi:MFS family permease
MRREAADGLRAVGADPLLRAMAGATLLHSLGFGIFSATYMLFVTRGLGFEPGVLGIIFGIGGVSSLAGALVAGRAAQGLGVGVSMMLGVALMGASMMATPLASGVTALTAAILIGQQVFGDGSFTVYDINSISLRQAITPERMLGRVNAFMRIVELAFMLGGTLAGGLLAHQFGLRSALAIGGAATFASAVVLFASPVRLTRAAPQSPADPLYQPAEMDPGKAMPF